MKKKRNSLLINHDRSLSLEEAALWKSVTENVLPLSGSVVDINPFTLEKRISSRKLKAVKRSKFDDYLNFAPLPKFDRRTSRNFKKGKILIEARLDLHGMIQNEAYIALSNFIISSYNMGRRCVQVITGKGKGGASQGILRSMVPRWLNQAPSHDKIISFSQSAPKDGGEGALYILLKKNREN